MSDQDTQKGNTVNQVSQLKTAQNFVCLRWNMANELCKLANFPVKLL